MVRAAALMLLLCACDRKAEILADEYQKAATSGEQCEVATKVAEAYLQRSDQKNYERWALTRDIDCLAAKSGG